MRHHYEPRRWHAASARVRKTAIYGPAGQIGKFINYLHLNYLISPFFISLFGPRVGTEPPQAFFRETADRMTEPSSLHLGLLPLAALHLSRCRTPSGAAQGPGAGTRAVGTVGWA